MRLIPRFVLFGCVLGCASSPAAQTKFAGKCSQGKLEPNVGEYGLASDKTK